jgi:RNA polymerase sigma factor (sigma-70 family)
MNYKIDFKKLEEIIPDIVIPMPEQEAETKELRRCVKAALAGMPREWQQVLFVHYVDGLAGPELAKAFSKTEPEIKRILEYAREYLRQRLMELRCKFKASASKTSSPAEVGANMGGRK